MIPANRLKRIAVTLSSGIALAFFFMAGTCWYSVRRTRDRASLFLEKALALDVGQSSTAEVLGIVDVSHGKSYGFDPCRTGKDCTGTVYFENLWFPRLGLAPRSGFAVRFRIEGGLLRSRYAALAGYVDSSEREAYVDESEPKPGKKNFAVRGYTKPYSLGVLLTTEAPDNLRKLAYKFNLDCLSRIRGCRTFQEFLPILQREDLVGPDPWVQSEEN